MSPFTPTARPHVAERRALQHLAEAENVTTAEPTARVAHARGTTVVRATGASSTSVSVSGASSSNPSHPAALPDLGPAWRDLLFTGQAPARPPARVLVAAPPMLERDVLAVVTPLCGEAARWDGRAPGPAPDLLIGALPWNSENLGDVPDLPGPLAGPPPALLPLTFGTRSVTVGPIAGAGGACSRCVVPVVADAAQRPDAALAPALFAFAAGTAGLFLRALAIGDVTACSISLTVDLAAPHIEHRLWSCAPTCRKAA